MEITGRAYVALGLYKNMAVEIYNCAPQFKAAGVSYEELQGELVHIREQLADIQPEDEDDQAEIDKIRKNIDQAEVILESTFAAASE